jgi:hypothetical protein
MQREEEAKRVKAAEEAERKNAEVAIVAYLYVSQPSTVGVAPEQTRTGQAK